MQIQKADFIKSAATQSHYPQTNKPEFAFFGRSNAGKSSLINMLVNRKNLVKTGSRPGMTRLINFFLINDSFVLTDLPGYGYAQRSKEENKAFDYMLYEYATQRPELKTIFFLMDLRRPPTNVEKDTILYFENFDIEVIVVATKADKLSNNKTSPAIHSMASYLQRIPELIYPTSAVSKKGRADILKLIETRLK
ncbi:MAG TPA: ribosome biogenesis GTP-binding protein YihA/YsxC [Treponemataceae bacterium]|nr:ribosome biogenesis GTP-binding protein YihA/YsxC [Treponemataceae bacterium]